MAFSTAQLDALEKAIADGTLTIEYSGAGGQNNRVTYRSLDEMIRIRDILRNSLGMSGSAGGKRYASFSKGTDRGC